MNESTVLIPLGQPTDVQAPADGDASAEPAPATVEVRRNAIVSFLVGVIAIAVAIAYLTRALGSNGSATDWWVCAALAALGFGNLACFLDARTPLLIADERGARIRLGRTWSGMTWHELDEVEHTPRRAWADGRLVLLPLDEGAAIERLSPSGRRQTLLNRRVHGSPFVVPLALTTRVCGADDLTEALLALVGDAAVVVEVDPSLPDHVVDDAPLDSGDGDADPVAACDDEATTDLGPVVAAASATPTPSPTPSPLRDVFRAVRSDVARGGRPRGAALEASRDAAAATNGATAMRLDHAVAPRTRTDLPEAEELRRGDPAIEETVAWSMPALGVAAEAEIEALAPRPAPDPVVGPVLAAARTRIGLEVTQLAERTRIRPHVIEAIEVDDFAPCGGDFYARGHLRTLARVVGVDAGPLIAVYDEQYADAPIDPRRVFEAELATGAGGAIRGTRGGPNWSVLVAAAMAVVLIWSIARLLLDGSVGITPPVTGIPGDSSGLTNPYGQAAPPVPVVVSAPAGGARLVIRDPRGRIVMNDQLAFGASRTIQVSLPVWISSTDGSVKVSVDHHDEGAMGETGQPAEHHYTDPD